MEDSDNIEVTVACFKCGKIYIKDLPSLVKHKCSCGNTTYYAMDSMEIVRNPENISLTLSMEV